MQAVIVLGGFLILFTEAQSIYSNNTVLDFSEGNYVKYLMPNYLFNSKPTTDFKAPFEWINKSFPNNGKSTKVLAGISGIFPLLQKNADMEASMRRNMLYFLNNATEANMPVILKLDCEIFADRPDLWNWWNTSLPGYNPDNIYNVEWSSWNSSSALKISWLNWGTQVRFPPPFNLMSPKYRSEVDRVLTVAISDIISWWKSLPACKKHLFAGIVLGWETFIGEKYYYHNGNRIYEKDPRLTGHILSDPNKSPDFNDEPGRGHAPQGFAAAMALGLNVGKPMSFVTQAEICRRHLESMSKIAFDLGVPREFIFTHVGAGDMPASLAGVNEFSSPGHTFYSMASNPGKSKQWMQTLNTSTSKIWGAVEYFRQSNDPIEIQNAITTTLKMRGMRVINFYNQRDIEASPNQKRVINEILEKGF
jgi:hypothetical protein